VSPRFFKLFVVALAAFPASWACGQNVLTHQLLAPPSVLLPYLQVDELKREIKLSAEQQEKTRLLVTESEANLKLQFKDRNAKEDTLAGKMQKLLLPKQIERLNQFYLQYNGGSALSNPRVQKLLGLSADQTKSVRQIDDDEGSKVMAINNARHDPEEERKKKQIALDEWRANKMDVLTSEQKKKLETLKGEKFGFDVSKIDI
jgi:hypothetical protein